MSGSIIFLHGASSSGKSTLARAVQDALPRPFWHVSIDKLRDAGVLPTARFASGDFDWKGARAAFFDGFHRSLPAFAGAGNDLIVEHILDDPRFLPELRRLLAPFDVLFVALHCPVDILEAREAARGDRPLGSARRDFETIHVGLRYDLELDTRDGVEANVRRVLSAWSDGTRRSDFAPDQP
ncbi:MAG: chloramphenicol phosphotransferase CPT family protein [Shimia sp.]